MNPHYVIGADIGGTHITAAIVDLHRKIMLPHTLVREKVDSRASAPKIIDSWSRAIKKVKGDRHIHQVSLAVPGPMDYDKGTCFIRGQAKYDDLYGLNIKHLLADELRTPSANIFLANDASSFLQGEVFGGAATGARSAIGVTLGTGLGTAHFENGKSVSCDLWDTPFGDSIAEDHLSTRWFVKRSAELGISVTGVSELKATGNDAVIGKIFKEFGTNLGLFLAAFMRRTSPEVVVLGGNIARSFDLFRNPLLAVVQPEFPDADIRLATLGEEAALLGAASHWKPSR